jgi:hypothetical protein
MRKIPTKRTEAVVAHCYSPSCGKLGIDDVALPADADNSVFLFEYQTV